MRFLLVCFLFTVQSTLWAQDLLIQGHVSDSLKSDDLSGAILRTNSGKGARCNVEGKFSMYLPAGNHVLKISCAGYQTREMNLEISSGNTPFMEIRLSPVTKELNLVTVSGSRFEKRTAEEIVSIEVIKPNYIQNTANNQMDDALQRVPGVDVVENQVNIRGGSGWSYGAGSRVLVLVDDMPMLTADAADAKWDFLPLENCEQVEVLKGASSSLYGSSALNGVINFRTGFARNKPKTKMMLYNGMYGNPRNKDWKWWGKQQPGFQGGYFMHSRKLGQIDMVLGSAWYSEDSYLQGDLNRRGRVNLNLRYRFKKIQGLVAGINTNIQRNKSQTFFLWDSSENGNLKPFGGLADSTTTINKNQGQRMNIDPYIQYAGPAGSKHVLRTRWFRSKNDIPEKKQSSKADTWYGEYQFQRLIQKEGLLNQLNVIAGMAGSYSDVIGELFGNHTVMNAAPYLQLEKKVGNRLWTSLGVRYEINDVDTYKTETRPVFRAGVNYELDRATFIRASYGQGYRYPSIAERFVSTSFGASRVFPNPRLQSETGWSAELGIRQGYQLGSWVGFIDLAGFWTEYQNMMEFNFGLHLPDDSSITQVSNVLDYIGFKSINVGDTRINGIDLSIMGQGKTLGQESRFILGYCYMNPIQLNPDSVIMANISGETRTLKYRYRHSLKFDYEVSYRKLSLGTTLLYNSFMQNIDAVFQNTKPQENIFGQLFEAGTGIPTTVNDFRTKYNQGTFLWDVRLAVQLSPQVKAAFVVKNLLNTVYSERPGIVGALRNFTLQLSAEL
ncbi:MAG: TonB-dependent receptor [Chitinophagaceae bacterium]|nr:TonB-dependent receptor [Chitinophagaceae bacterium]